MIVLNGLQVNLRQSRRIIRFETLREDLLFGVDMKTRNDEDENLPVCYNVKLGIITDPASSDLLHCYPLSENRSMIVQKAEQIKKSELEAECEATYKLHLKEEYRDMYSWDTLCVLQPETASQIRDVVAADMPNKAVDITMILEASDFQKQIISALAGHQVEGKQIVQGLKAAGIADVPDIRDNFLGGWLGIDCTIEQFAKQLATV